MKLLGTLEPTWEQQKTSRAMFWGGWMTEYHKHHLSNDILTKPLELARILGRGGRCWLPCRASDAGTSLLSSGTQVFSESRSSACHRLFHSSVWCWWRQCSSCVWRRNLQQGIWEVLRCISELDSTLELFHYELLLVLLDIPRKRRCHSPPPAEISFKRFLLFPTTETFSHC